MNIGAPSPALGLKLHAPSKSEAFQTRSRKGSILKPLNSSCKLCQESCQLRITITDILSHTASPLDVLGQNATQYDWNSAPERRGVNFWWDIDSWKEIGCKEMENNPKKTYFFSFELSVVGFDLPWIMLYIKKQEFIDGLPHFSWESSVVEPSTVGKRNKCFSKKRQFGI